jgi:hypothetical protein
LSAIAKRFGISSYGKIYNDPHNDEFRELRPNPNLIQPGDQLWIPDPPPPADSAGDRASLNASASAVMPDDEPSAQKSCPLKKILRIGVFFDGTDANKDRDESRGCLTNIARLWRLYIDTADAAVIRDKLYIVGVGSLDENKLVEEDLKDFQELGDDPTLVEYGIANVKDAGTVVYNTAVYWGAQIEDLAGGMAAHGARQRIETAYEWAKSKCLNAVEPEAEKTIDVYGFSRGAALARSFVNLANQALKQVVPNVRVRFVGLFDTVETYFRGIDGAINCGIGPGDADSILHYVSIQEHRHFFPLTTTGSDIPYVGVHCDVGGGYGPPGSDSEGAIETKMNRLAFVPLDDMHKASLAAAVEIKPWQGLPDATGVDVDQLRARSEAYKDDMLSDASRDFKERYIHESANWGSATYKYTKNLAEWENGGRRRILPNEKLQLLKMPRDFKWQLPEPTPTPRPNAPPPGRDAQAAAAGAPGGSPTPAPNPMLPSEGTQNTE